MIDLNKDSIFTINCQGNIITLDEPKIMGVLNLTPDSFYDGGYYKTELDILHQAEKLLLEGADFIDVGAVSTKPNAPLVSLEDEKKRLLPILKSIKKSFPNSLISVDTFRHEIAQLAVDEGASIINDIYAGKFDDAIFDVAAKNNTPIILMHMQGTPQTMQNKPIYNDITTEILDFFIERIAVAKSHQVKDIIIDVGFGFGKTLEHNYQLLKNMNAFKMLNLPILAGVSRKSMIYKLLENTPQQALNGTTVVNLLALQNGAKLLRVHDVKEAKECVKIFNFYQSV